MSSMARERSGSIAAQVRAYIDTHPTVKDALDMEIVNLSALSRRIMDETGLGNEEAVLTACRRYEPEDNAEWEARIRKVLAKSSLEVRTRVASSIVRGGWRLYGRLEEAMKHLRGRTVTVHLIHGSEGVTIILDEGILHEFLETIGEEDVIQTTRGLVEISLRSPQTIEEVPGILAYLTSTLAENGINIVECVSSWKDTMFVIEEKDLFTTFEVLNRLIRG